MEQHIYKFYIYFSNAIYFIQLFATYPHLLKNQPFQQICTLCFWCWWYVLISCFVYTNTDTCIDMRSFIMLCYHRSILFDMRYVMILTMVAKILLFLSKDHDTVQHATVENTVYFSMFCRALPIRNDHGMIDRYPSLLDYSF